jgi:hypothetical protein
MPDWKPKEKKIYPATYDFEWVVDGENQVPYAYGMFFGDDQYLCHLSHEGIYDSFINNLYKMADEIFLNQYCPEMGQQKFKNEKEMVKAMQTKSQFKCVISLFAHNGHKADYPLVEKTLLESSLFRMEGQCASGMAKISYTYKVMGKYEPYQLYV